MTTLLDQYSTHQRVLGYSRRTIGQRAWSVGLWQRFLEARDVTLHTATVADLVEFLDRWPAPQSRYSVRSDLRQFYRWARTRGLYDGDDPTDGLPPVKVPRRAATPIPADDVRQLLATITRRRDLLIVMLAAYAGLRISEISAIRGEDVDLGAGLLIVRAGKGGSDGIVPLAAELAAELADWPSRGRLVPISGPAVGDRIRTLLRAARIDGRPHDLRHSFGTQAARRSRWEPGVGRPTDAPRAGRHHTAVRVVAHHRPRDRHRPVRRRRVVGRRRVMSNDPNPQPQPQPDPNAPDQPDDDREARRRAADDLIG